MTDAPAAVTSTEPTPRLPASMGAIVRDRLLLTGAAGVAAAWTYWISLIPPGVPRLSGYEGSLLRQASPLLALIVAAASVAVSAALGSIIARRVHWNAGLFAAGIGLSVLAIRCGPLGPVLRAQGVGVYGWLVAETIILAALLAVALGLMWRQNQAVHDGLGDTPPDPEASLARRLSAFALHAAATALLLWIFAQTGTKKQALIGVGLSGFLASLIAHGVVPIRGSAAFAFGPLAVAAVGYAWAAFSPGQAALGWPANPLAAPTPLDYASFGVAGALWGYWTSRGWQIEQAHRVAMGETSA